MEQHVQEGSHYKRTISVNELVIGSYVSDLDRPWTETPFLFQGFIIESIEQIEELKRFCQHVCIDIEKSKTIITKKESVLPQHTKEPIKSAEITPQYKPNKEYKASTSVEAEFTNAKKIHASLKELTSNIYEDVIKGKTIDLTSVKNTTEQMIDSIIRNPDALLWLTVLKKQDSLAYAHAINVSAYMIAFGRHLGFPKSQMMNLGITGLLQDIGKAKIPKEILTKSEKLTSEEQTIVQKHVGYSIKLVSNNPEVPQEVIEIIKLHHERVDGSGYPKGLKGEEISIFGGIAGIADCFEAMTSKSSYSKAMSSYEALQHFYKLRNKSFHEGLVEQFIQCIGIYSAGSIVELNTGEVAVIIEQNRKLRLKPKVMLFLDSDKKAFAKSVTINLADNTNNRLGKPYSIKSVLEPRAYGIDPQECFI